MLWQLPAPHPVHAGHSLQTAIVPALRITSVADDSNRDTGQGNASKSAPSVMNGTRRCDVWIAVAVRWRPPLHRPGHAPAARLPDPGGWPGGSWIGRHH